MTTPGSTSVHGTRVYLNRDEIQKTPLFCHPVPLPVSGLDVSSPSRAPRAWKLVGKRMIDIVVASLGLVMTAPLFLVIALSIKIDSRGSVFFVQRRVGRGGRPFTFLKFRTMCVDAERQLTRDPELFRVYLANACKLPADRDPRVTRVGRVLRRASLDELPQIINVLLGHMSLVGPRPVTSTELTFYGPSASALLSMRPGMTGAWAVSGRSNVGYPMRARIELDYVGRWSLRTDARILLKTIPAVVSANGAH